MDATIIGKPIRKFEVSREPWEKTILALGSSIFVGILCVGFGIYQSFSSGTIQWSMPLIGLVLCGISGHMLFRLRPTLMSVTVCEDGIQVSERLGDTEVPWAEVEKVERVNHKLKHESSISQLFFETSGEVNLLFGSSEIIQFDDFVQLVLQNSLIESVFEEINT